MAMSASSGASSFFFFFFFLLFAVFFFFFFEVAHSATFTLRNHCPFPVWPATLTGGNSPPLQQTGFSLGPGAGRTLDVPPRWSGRLWARTRCSVDPTSGRFSCLSGDCGSGRVQCDGAGGAAPATLAEFTLQGDAGKDFYDVSNVDGFNLPMAIAPQGGSGAGCAATTCTTDLNAHCPSELQSRAPDGRVVGCKSACLAFNTDQYCCRGAFGGPNTCRPSQYARLFKSACPQAYSYAYDDSSSTFTCTGANYVVTFCP